MCTALERLKAEGIEQGMEKGVEKTVISMLKKNYPISEICEITGKTEEEILKIKETLQCMGDIRRYLLCFCAEIRHNMSFMKCYRGEDVQYI